MSGSGHDNDGNNSDERNKDKRTDYDRANAKGEVSASSPEIYDFLASLFDGVEKENFPSHIEVRQVKGRNCDVMGDLVRKIGFTVGSRPGNERLVAISNEILDRLRKDCDVRKRETVYHIAAWNSQLNAEPYDRVLYRAKPRKTWAGRGEELGLPGHEGDDDEDAPYSHRYNIAQLGNQQRMFELVGGMIEGLIDRSDRQAAFAYSQLERAQLRNIELLDMNLRLVQADDERFERRERAKMWRDNIGKGLDLAWGLIPPMLSSFTGKNGSNAGWVMGTESPEAMTLRKFFETKETGGIISDEQFEIILGKPVDGKPMGGGILSKDQVTLLVQIASKQANPDDLDLLLPGGPLEITMEQIGNIIGPPPSGAGIPLEALAPIKMLLDVRLAKRQSNETPKEK